MKRIHAAQATNARKMNPARISTFLGAKRFNWHSGWSDNGIDGSGLLHFCLGLLHLLRGLIIEVKRKGSLVFEAVASDLCRTESQTTVAVEVIGISPLCSIVFLLCASLLSFSAYSRSGEPCWFDSWSHIPEGVSPLCLRALPTQGGLAS